MKKFLCLFLMIALLICSTTAFAEESTFATRGLELVRLTAEMMQNESYLNMMTASENIRDALRAQAAPALNEEPEHIHLLVPDLETSVQLLLDVDATGLTQLWSEALVKEVQKRAVTSFATLYNATAGVEALAASSMCTAGTCFVSDEYTVPVMMLYTFANGVQMMVTFTPGLGGAVGAQAVPLMAHPFPTDPEALAAMLEEMEQHMEVTVLK